MIIRIPVAHFVSYNTARYVRSALDWMGHDAKVIDQGVYYQDLPDVDLFFAVDSGGPLNFPEKHRAKTAMWFIDSRHNCDPTRRLPDDDTNAKTLADGGGWIFQAQKKDWQRNCQTGVERSTWLPLAADSSVWECKDPHAPKIYDVGFGGNVWCDWRRAMLDRIRAKGWVRGQWIGTPEELASGYCASRVGFNCSSFFGGPVAYDINMRAFEVMACGIPLVSNRLPEMEELGIHPDFHYLPYDDADGAMSQIRLLLSRSEAHRLDMGVRNRSLILDGHTYIHRMRQALGILTESGMI
jgi:hypothetical protein